MLRIRERLRDETGTALIDAMFGIIIAALALIGLSSISVTATNAIIASGSQTARQTFIVSLTNQLASDPLSVSTMPTTAIMAIDEVDSEVTTWRETTTESTTIFAAARRDTAGAEVDCTDPSDLPTGCLVAETTVSNATVNLNPTEILTTWTVGSLGGTTAVQVTPGQLGSFNAPAGLTEARYVLKVTSSTSGTITFTDQDTGNDVVTIVTAPSATQYYYGSLYIVPGHEVQITYNGAPTGVSHFFIYEAPQ